MKPATLLRIAAILTLIHFASHTFGGMLGAPKPAQIPVLEVMKSHHFDVMGSSRSYWDFYFGFGMFVSVNLLIQAVLFWQLATFAKTGWSQIRPIVLLFSLGYLVFALLSWKYFFVGPLVFEIAIAACLGWAWRTAQPQASA